MEKTSGIVLHHFSFRETSVIAKVFTREAGLQSFIVPGVRKAKARIRQNMFQPLTLVDMVFYRKPHGGLQHIRELSSPSQWQYIPFDISKTSIAIFIAEMLGKVLKESDAAPAMFDFVRNAIAFLDQHQGRNADFHLVFLLKLSRYLGFSPGNIFDEEHCFFCLHNGLFQTVDLGPELCLNKEQSRHFFELSNVGFDNLDEISLNSIQRKILLNRIIEFYRIHLTGLKEIKSHQVLESVLH